MSVTIKDVAREAGVSVVTVSRVLNGTYPSKVGEATREKVLRVARELNYRPSPIARGLRKGRTMLVGVIVPALTGSFTAETVQGIQDQAESKDFSILLYTTDYNPEKFEKFIRLLWEKRVDGILCFNPTQSHRELMEKIIDSGTRIVQMFFDDPSLNAPAVVVDQWQGSRLAVNHLIELGHRRILHLSAAEFDAHGAIREKAFSEAMQACHGAEPSIVSVGYDWKCAYQAVREVFLSDQQKPTAIFAACDMTALGAIKALRELNIMVPQDVSVVGFDGLPVTEITYPGLTTVAQPKYEVGRIAMQMLDTMISGKTVDSVRLKTEIVIRASTSPLVN